ncbi:MAG: hypothetical protein M1823_000660 [Watsoniomyces obsoletus]|nr:MAG: hypothetical protein M1823_000660 [Watsoniomyces obsoletus]
MASSSLDPIKDGGTGAPSSSSNNPTPLSFPSATFAKLTPRPFLLAHLEAETPPNSSSTSPSTGIQRPNGRGLSEFRPVSVHLSSLTHTEGSATVRCGQTTVVCGIKAKILYSKKVAKVTKNPLRKRSRKPETDIQSKNLVVPNVELSTGCTPAHLPGQPPSRLAQTITARIQSLLRTTRLIPDEDLRIYHQPLPKTFVTSSAAVDLPPKVIKAWWTLYIDVVFLALDGNAFDAAWLAVFGALVDLRLPNAKWDPARRVVLCSDSPRATKRLNLKRCPAALTFTVFTNRQPGGGVKIDQLKGNNNENGKEKKEGDYWILTDPDAFEEELCLESITITIDVQMGTKGLKIVKVEKAGGGVVGKENLRDLVRVAQDRWMQWFGVLGTEMKKRS